MIPPVPSDRPARPRPGHTLPELLVVITVASSLVVAAVGLVYAMTRFQLGDAEQARFEAGLDVLADQFRDDVHAATRFKPMASAAPGQAQAPVWEFRLGSGRRVEYRVDHRRLIRLELDQDKVVRREAFGLPRDAAVSIEAAERDTPGLVGLRIMCGPGAEGGGPRWPVHVDALLAMDYRFAPPVGE
jgi:hypothetical protein